MPSAQELPPHTASNQFAAIEENAKDRLTNGIAHSPPSREEVETAHRHIWLVTGPAGCGKTTVAEYVAHALKIPYLEGDNFHPPANIKKMSEGHPLQDQDRWDWLISLRTACTDVLAGKTPKTSNAKPVFETKQDKISPENPPRGVVLTCSALKRKYRDVIRIANYNDPSVMVHFIYLHASEELLLKRVAERKGHYMGAQMVHSQFESLEIPTKDEFDVLRVDVGGTKAEVEAEALRKVEEIVHGEVQKDADA